MNKKSFERNSFILFVLMVLANIINYIFQIVMAQLMTSVEDYGTLNTLLSIFTIFLVPNAVMILSTAHYTAKFLALGEEQKLVTIIKKLLKILTYIIVIMIVIGALLAPLLSSILKINQPYYVFAIILIAISLLVSSVFLGILQGEQLFYQYGIQNLLNVLCKLVFSIILILIGWKIWGILLALLIGSIITFVYSSHFAKKYLKQKSSNELINTKDMLFYMVGTFCIQICLNFLMNCDVLLVKVFFDNEVTGIYSSAMLIGKIGMYLSGAVVTTLFPIVAEKRAKNEYVNILLYKSLLYGGGMSILCAIGMLTLGRPFISILFGTKYIKALIYLPAVCAFIVPLTFLTITVNFIIAMGKTKVVSFILFVGSIACVLSTVLFHNSVNQMLYIIGMNLMLQVIGNLFVIYKESKIT